MDTPLKSRARTGMEQAARCDDATAPGRDRANQKRHTSTPMTAATTKCDALHCDPSAVLGNRRGRINLTPSETGQDDRWPGGAGVPLEATRVLAHVVARLCAAQ